MILTAAEWLRTAHRYPDQTLTTPPCHGWGLLTLFRDPGLQVGHDHEICLPFPTSKWIEVAHAAPRLALLVKPVVIPGDIVSRRRL